ncbi:MAG: nucleotidyltransferase substrate binding protein [Prevotella sp.]|uniref:nucleotidyltransferase substrate binding protein n=1 Tax=Leyella stercorea TaxID=363265 RepID=UPI0025DCF810|nr:nucleotidyltransferase substrate binding protein [Prevotella sp.]MDD7212262.1 nucleotidyltransferase substrate binding protein [Leyella stercorea]MDY3732653.1 nucleotidyltransferase substrate binding protein [Alloprevotella sp.]MCI6197930.1 nucleotidyltransferase substrate binding protein [Prevotella sp.]MCI7424111.1 nucleotidyltransferase substrate binding protein [Prevotella sp.]
MINIPRWEQRLDSYHKALARLAEIVGASKKRALNEFERDGLVQRFEFTHELSWKLMKAYAEYQGFDGIGGSRDATRKAFEMSLISDGQSWMDMIKSRNETSHNYDGSMADDVVDSIINRFYPLLAEFYQKMNSLSALTPDDLFSK